MINIFELREKMGWSKEKLADEIGVSLSTILLWEKDEVKPSRLAKERIKVIIKKFSQKNLIPPS